MIRPAVALLLLALVCAAAPAAAGKPPYHIPEDTPVAVFYGLDPDDGAALYDVWVPIAGNGSVDAPWRPDVPSTLRWRRFDTPKATPQESGERATDPQSGRRCAMLGSRCCITVVRGQVQSIAAAIPLRDVPDHDKLLLRMVRCFRRDEYGYLTRQSIGAVEQVFRDEEARAETDDGRDMMVNLVWRMYWRGVPADTCYRITNMLSRAHASARRRTGSKLTNLPCSTPEEKAQNLREAVRCYQQALEVFREDQYPVQYAETQNDMGSALMGLPWSTPEEQAQNLWEAIRCHREALKVYSTDQYPVQYAETLNSLGVAYMSLPPWLATGQNVQWAIRCYEEVLQVYRRDEYPTEYAGTHNNLGVAFMVLPWSTAGERAANLRQAVRCFQEALEVHRNDGDAHQCAPVALNIGHALAQLGDPDAGRWLEEAHSLRQSLDEQRTVTPSAPVEMDTPDARAGG